MQYLVIAKYTRQQESPAYKNGVLSDKVVSWSERINEWEVASLNCFPGESKNIINIKCHAYEIANDDGHLIFLCSKELIAPQFKPKKIINQKTD